MKKSILFLVAAVSFLTAAAQGSDETLMTINGKPVSAGEF